MNVELYLELEPVNKNVSGEVLEEIIEGVKDFEEDGTIVRKNERGAINSILIETPHCDTILIDLRNNGMYRVEIRSGSFDRAIEYGRIVRGVRDRYFQFYGPRIGNE